MSRSSSSTAQMLCKLAQLSSLAILALSCITQSTLARAAPAPKQELHAGVSLNSDNWNEKVSEGIWLVEHYSPYCHHCKDFAPTWIQLVNDKEEAYKSINTHFGQVDCSVQGDLCDSNEVKGYPSIFLYENGEFVDWFKKERTMEKLTKWLDARLPDLPSSDTDDFEDPIPAPLPVDADLHKSGEAERTTSHEGTATVGQAATGAVAAAAAAVAQGSATGAAPAIFNVQENPKVHKRVVPNQDGNLLSMKSAKELETLLDPENQRGPAFVKYYAPWCGHCKALAPTWKDLAATLKGKVNVIEFNCDLPENKPKCRKEGISGYPTLVFYNAGERAEYQGSRGLSQLEAFASKAALATGMRDMSPYELNTIGQEEDVFFLYLYPSNTPTSDLDMVHAASRTLLGSAPVYKSSSPDLFNQFNYPQTHPSLLVFKDHQLKPVASLNFTEPHSSSTSSEQNEERRNHDTAEIVNWLSGNKHPTLAELSSTNFKDYFEEGQTKSESYIALAVLSPKRLGPPGMVQKKEDLHRIAKAWRDGLRVSPREKPVNFVWVNLDKWGKYLSSNYGISPTQSESIVVVIDPTREVFYPLDQHKSTIKIEGRQIFSALDSLYEGRLKAVSSTTITDKVGKFIYDRLTFFVTIVGSHPFMSMFIGFLLFVVFFGVLVYIMEASESGSSSPRHQPKSVNNGAGLYAPSSNAGVKKD